VAKGAGAAASIIPATVAAAFDANDAWALGAGILGVILSRTVFVDRESKRTRKRQTIRETMPLTLVAILITSVLTVDYHLVLSKAAFLGLGVGWTAVFALDVIGERVLGLLAPSRVKLTDMHGLDELPESMNDLLRLADRRTPDAPPLESDAQE
jgi:hypothetical protein